MNNRGGLLKRVGFWLVVAAVLIHVVGPNVMPQEDEGARPGESQMRALAFGGSVMYSLGLVVGLLPDKSKRCPRCGVVAARGTVFCRIHQRELAQATLRVAARNLVDDRRGW